MIFDSFWGRLGVVLGTVLGSKIVPKSLGRLTLGGLDFDLVIGWSQDGRQDHPKRVQEPPRAAQELPRPSQENPKPPKIGPRLPKTVQRGPKSPPEQLKNPLILSSWGRFGVRFVDSTHRLDSMMQSIDSIRRFDSLASLTAYRLNKSSRRNARRD